jgi:hypothetical protein
LGFSEIHTWAGGLVVLMYAKAYITTNDVAFTRRRSAVQSRLGPYLFSLSIFLLRFSPLARAPKEKDSANKKNRPHLLENQFG